MEANADLRITPLEISPYSLSGESSYGFGWVRIRTPAPHGLL